MDATAATLDHIVAAAVIGQKVQAAALLVAREGEVVCQRAYEQPPVARVDRVYDLASLTKVLATTTSVMLLVDEGALSLETRVADVLPALAALPSGALRVTHLLEHSAGLPGWRPYYELVARREAAGLVAPSRNGAERKALVRQLVAAEPLEGNPGEQTVYGDAAFLLLEWIVETLSGERLDAFFARRVVIPLGLSHVFFIDLDAPGERAMRLERYRFAETELCPWRDRRLVAEVQDDTAHAVGGIAGHCGLFASAYDIHIIARELVAAYRGARSIFGRDVVRAFFDHRSAVRYGDSRALGWQLPHGHDAGAGQAFSPQSVGHNGYTGTSLWIDLAKRLWVVLLTNRLYYGRENRPMVSIRTQVHDEAHLSLG
ncbi:MAG: serine hydrolase [Myxococcales bacterium]|nr:serine hydrolase [Myxococcales bacterium]